MLKHIEGNVTYLNVRELAFVDFRNVYSFKAILSKMR